jgi:hypothetical protein
MSPHSQRRGDSPKAIPGAGFDASPIEEARKQRIETLESRIMGGEKLESVSQKENKNSTRTVDRSGEKCLDELLLLRNYAAPCRERNQQAIEIVKSDEQPRPVAKPFTYDEMVLDSPSPDSPKPDSLHKIVWAVLRKGSPCPDGLSGYEADDSDAPTVTSATNAAVWRSESKYDSSPEEERQQEENRARRLSTNSVGSLTDVEQWVEADIPESSEPPWRRDSGLGGLEGIKSGLADEYEDEGEEAKLAEPSLKKSVSRLLGSFPLSDGRRGQAIENHAPVQETAQGHLEHEKPRLKSMLRKAARHSRGPTSAEKGKSPAKCECPKCQPQGYKRVRFDSSAMEKAEDGPGLSHEGYVKRMSENRRRMEADPRGEGCSSWARAGPAELVGLGTFTNPRPAPRVPVPVPVPVRRQESFTVFSSKRCPKSRVNRSDVGEPVGQNKYMNPGDRYSVFPPAHEFPSPCGPAAGETAEVTPQRTDRRGRRQALLKWAQRLKW